MSLWKYKGKSKVKPISLHLKSGDGSIEICGKYKQYEPTFAPSWCLM
jgi:hypothetical protein